jgi:hypothetical protein
LASIIDLLQKLMTHEKSARAIGSTEEAQAFAAKVQTILTNHKLTMSEVEFEAQKHSNPMGETVVEGSKTNIPTWTLYIQQSLARNYFCKCFGIVGSGQAYFVGRETDRTAAVQMYVYLIQLGEAFAKKDCAAYADSRTILDWASHNAARGCTKKTIDKALKSMKAVFSKSFLLGYGLAIQTRLDTTRKDLDASADSHGRSMIVRNTASVDEYCAERFETKAVVRKPKSGSQAGMIAGAARGSQVALNNSKSLGSGA